jgi:hypothetical protein
MKEIDGFCGCTSLCRIQILSSVEMIGRTGFHGCTSLNEIIFSSDSQMKEIDGFCGCTSLCSIEISSSINIIRGFQECTLLRAIIIHTGCRIGNNEGFRFLNPFLVHEDSSVKESRRLVHLGTFC